MKKIRFPLELTPEQHKQIRIKAAEAGKNMKTFLLDCVNEYIHSRTAFKESSKKDNLTK